MKNENPIAEKTIEQLIEILKTIIENNEFYFFRLSYFKYQKKWIIEFTYQKTKIANSDLKIVLLESIEYAKAKIIQDENFTKLAISVFKN